MMKKIKFTLSEEDSFRDNVLSKLSKKGKVGAETGIFLQKRNVHLRFNKQKNSAAAWTLSGNIRLNVEVFPRGTEINEPFLLSLIVHEARHLQQGFLTALSVYGELDAWQMGFNFFKELTGSPLEPVLSQIIDLPLNWSRANLKQASGLMKEYSPGYRVDLLPLYPIHREIVWWLTRKEPE